MLLNQLKKKRVKAFCGLWSMVAMATTATTMPGRDLDSMLKRQRVHAQHVLHKLIGVQRCQ